MVHEWGVWMRKDQLFTRTCQLAKEAKREFATNLASAVHAFEELPDFVLRHAVYSPPECIASETWSKPVLHFYGAEGQRVRVVVQTAKGRPTAYWPPPKLLTTWSLATGVKLLDPDIMVWNGILKTAAPDNLKECPDEHWWSTVRKIPSKYLSAKEASERFIFYEGTAHHEPNIIGKVGEAELTLTNRCEAPSGLVLAIFNDGEQLFLRKIETIEGKASVKLAKAEWLAAPSDANAIIAAAIGQWRSFGMTAEEATAITGTWKPELTQTLGFLIAYRLPEAEYAALFPLDINPEPQKLVRAGVIFDTLPGEKSRANWLPKLTGLLEKASKDLGAEDPRNRSAARKMVLGFGDLAVPFLEHLTENRDAEIQNAATELLDAIVKPAQVDLQVPERMLNIGDFLKQITKRTGNPPGSEDFKLNGPFLQPIKFR